MEFTIERIPDGEKEHLDMGRWKKYDSFYVEPRNWIADKNHKTYFYCIRAMGLQSMESVFGLDIAGYRFIIEAEMNYAGQKEIHVEWLVLNIQNIEIKWPEWEEMLEDVKAITKHLLKQYGIGISRFSTEARDRTVSVNVRFKSNKS